jgi:hypothetical protein
MAWLRTRSDIPICLNGTKRVPPSRRSFLPAGAKVFRGLWPRSPPRARPYFWSTALPYICVGRIADMTPSVLLRHVHWPIFSVLMLIRPVPPPSGPGLSTPGRRRILLPRRRSNRQTAYSPPSPDATLDLDFVRSQAPLFVSGAFFSSTLRRAHGCSDEPAFVEAGPKADSLAAVCGYYCSAASVEHVFWRVF